MALLDSERLEPLGQNIRLETRYQASKSLKGLFAGDEGALVGFGTAMGHGHSVDLVINQFGAKLVSAFMKVDANQAWSCYSRLHPTTVGDEMAALLNAGEFSAMHRDLHQQLQLARFSIREECEERVANTFPRIDSSQFAGPGPGSLADLRRDGLSVALDPRHAAEVAAVAQRLGESPLPITEMIKDDRLVTVSGKAHSKVSLVVHDLVDHLWTFDLLERRGLLDEYEELLASIGDPHLRDIRSREGEVIASIAFGVRFFNTVEPGFTPVVSAERLRRILEDAVRDDGPARRKRALETLRAATTDERTGRFRPTLESQSLSFVFSNYITELNEQRRKHGKIKQRVGNGGVRELPTFDADFVAFFVECHHELVTPKNEHRNTLARAQLIIEEWLLDIIDQRIDPPFVRVLTLDELCSYRPEITRVRAPRVRWMLDHYGFAATPVDLT